MTTYKINCGGQPVECEGDIFGPFGVSKDQQDGIFHVTHLHTGLKIAQFSSEDRLECINAARLLHHRVPWWLSHKKERIAKENNMTTDQLRQTVEDVAFKCVFYGSDGAC